MALWVKMRDLPLIGDASQYAGDMKIFSCIEMMPQRTVGELKNVVSLPWQKKFVEGSLAIAVASPFYTDGE